MIRANASQQSELYSDPNIFIAIFTAFVGKQTCVSGGASNSEVLSCLVPWRCFRSYTGLKILKGSFFSIKVIVWSTKLVQARNYGAVAITILLMLYRGSSPFTHFATILARIAILDIDLF